LKVLVVGAGGVGGYYGALLARANHEVAFVARGDHGQAIRERGLLVELPNETFSVEAQVFPSVMDAAGFAAEVAIVAVKSDDLAGVAPGVGAALADGGVAIPLLNGLDSEEALAAVIGRSRVVGGIAQIAARKGKPGVVHVDSPARMVLAPLSPHESEQRPLVERIAAEFSRAGFGCDVKTNLQSVLWSKLLWNAPFNAICALTRKSAGEVLKIPELETLVRAAMQELVAVARAEGVELDAALLEGTIEATRTRFAASRPSMLQDVLAGRKTEARELQGAVVRRGRAHGVETPVTSALLALMLGLE
jgi:2-dehydropantoate 2-reductase